MAAEASGSELVQVVALLTAGVVAVPIFRRMGLGSILGYLAAGLVIGPFGLRHLSRAEAILHVAELGVVMFLFIIGLEMQPSRLWSLRREIFGLGAMQVGVCALLLTGVGVIGGFPVAVSFVAGAGFVLTSTAIVMQILEERGDVSTPKGQRIVSILLFEDLAIVPLLALVAFLAPAGAEMSLSERLVDVAIGVASIVGLIVAGRYLLNPLFRVLADSRAREVMTAAALLVVLGSALAMQLGGLSMAMGAFLAGVMLSESTFRHQLEADVEPFRGILLGLFFMAVGMSLDLSVVAANWQHGRDLRRRLHGHEGARHLCGRAHPLEPSRRAGARRHHGAGRRVRLRALFGGDGRRHHRRRGERHPDRDHHRLDDPHALRHRDPARRHAEGRADARRRRHRRRTERQRAHHRLRPFRADRQPALAASRRRRLDHRQ